MKKTFFLLATVIFTSSFACAEAVSESFEPVYEALKSCSEANIQFSNGSVKIHEQGAGMCSYVSTFDNKTTSCTMPISMARKLSIFKTLDTLNDAQVADMQDIEKKYCKTK